MGGGGEAPEPYSRGFTWWMLSHILCETPWKTEQIPKHSLRTAPCAHSTFVNRDAHPTVVTIPAQLERGERSMSVDHTPLLRCFIGLVCFTSFCGASQHGAEPINNPMSSQRLAVVVPCYRGDLYRTVASLERWPTECSPVTLKNTDLVLYYAEGEKDNQAVTSAVSTISAKAGQCFAKTRIVYANIDIEVRS